MDTAHLLVIFATVVNAMLVGAALDQHIKQLPARHRIGVVAFSEYSKAADLSNGVAWYAGLGIGAALLAVVAAGVNLADQPGSGAAAAALWCAIAFTIAHSLITTRAARINFSQRQAVGDADRLAAIFDRFTRWSTVRVACQCLTLLALMWALIALR